MKYGPSAVAWTEFHRLLPRYRGPLELALGLIVVNRAAGLALPSASKYVVDEVIGRHQSDRLGLIALLACAAVTLEAATGFAAAQVAGVAGQRAIAGLRQELQARMLGLPLRHIDEFQSGTLADRVMTDSEQVRYLIGNGLVQLVASLVTAALALALLLWLDAPLTLAVLAIMGLVALGVRRGFRHITAAFEGVIRRRSELTGWFGQVLGGIRVVKAYALERHEAFRFTRESHHLVRETVQALRGISLLNSGSTLAAGSLGVLLLVVGGRAVAAGSMSLGSFVMYIWLTGLLFAPVIDVAAGAGELAKAVAALGRIAALRELLTEEEEDRDRLPVAAVKGAVTFEDVWFNYPDGREAIRGLSFHVSAGSIVALVGPTGSGKSTTAHLVAALRSPTAGRVLVDGRDLASLRRREYRRCLAVVPQEIVLFSGTIADNIRYARPHAAMDDVRRAARLAQCEEFVTRLPESYATLVGEDGMLLSAGQRQRVALARAILADPRILILDEPTSHLDVESEALVQDALRVLCLGRTVLVIAHRLATVEQVDELLVLESGAMVERGTHQDLMNRQGKYWAMHEAQERWRSNESLRWGQVLSWARPARPDGAVPQSHGFNDNGATLRETSHGVG
ncbi:MAG: ABC transporter ATP-binding protein [Woeseiaceae bacterium]